jgi:hypothetical protein
MEQAWNHLRITQSSLMHRKTRKGLLRRKKRVIKQQQTPTRNLTQKMKSAELTN